MERVRVSLVSESQHESLAALLCELHEYYSEGSAVSSDLVRSYLVDCLLQEQSGLRLVVAADEGGSVVGFAAIALTYSLVEPQPERRRHCWLKELYVAAASRGRGVGTQLMSWVAHHAIANDCCRIDWPVQAANGRGIAFYEALGAKQCAERLSFRLSGPELLALAVRQSVEHD